MNPEAGKPLLEVRDLKVHFPVRKGFLFPKVVGEIRAVDGISFAVGEGKTLGLVGESGCGKSSAARAILQLYRPTAGEVLFEDQDLVRLTQSQLRPIRRRIQMVFQDPYSSLDPRMTAGEAVGEPLAVHRLCRGRERREKVALLLGQVGLAPQAFGRYPHEFSGGQRQRIAIARALATGPRLIVCDEPLAALDVSIRAQIVNLLRDLQEQLGISYLFIAHDLAIVRHFAHEVAVMYLGRIVERAPKGALFRNPLHPYTRALLRSIPVPDPKVEARKTAPPPPGDVPSAETLPPGCPFHPRCPDATDRCRAETPRLQEKEASHTVACHLYDSDGA